MAATGVLAVFAGGCGSGVDGEALQQAGDDAGGKSTEVDAGDRASMPNIYVDQTIETLDGAGGGNPARESYLAARDLCVEAGIAVQPLAESDVEKLGTSRLQRWITPDSAAYRNEEWGAGTAGSSTQEQMCQFVLVSTGVHLYVDSDRMVTLDLGTNEMHEQKPKATLLQRGPSLSMEDAKASQVAKASASAVSTPVEAVEAGQPCLQWQSLDDMGSFCVWSGGTEWGFSVKPGRLLDSHSDDLLGRIVLKQEPGRSNPTRVTTREFTLGGKFDDDAMLPVVASGSLDKPQ